MDAHEENGVAERLKAAADALEEIVADRSLLEELPLEERTRLLAAAGDVHNPDVVQRRRCSKVVRREKKAARLGRDEAVLAETGIRVLRDEAGVHDAERLPARRVRAGRRRRRAGVPRGGRAAALLRLQAALQRASTPSTTSSVPACGDFNFAQAHGDRRPARPRRAAHRRAREDRLPGRDQAAPRRRAADRHDALPARRGGALRGRAGLRGLGRPARGLRARPAPHAERRGVLLAPELDTRDRLDFIVNNACQTVRRPPDFYRHMLEARDGVGGAMPAHVRRLLGAYEGLRRADILPAARRRRAPRSSASRARPSSRRCRCCRRTLGRRRPLPRGPARPGPAAGRPARAQLVAAAARRGVVGRAARDAARERGRAVRAQRAPEAAACCATPERDKHIVNVSAVEGQFYRRFKTTRHPHTNMAKAALNMMTRTSAADYHADGIHMNSVDTGWVTDEDPVAHRRAQDGRARLPSAARHRRRRGAHRRSDHRRLQHRRARLGPVPEGLQADRLVSAPGRDPDVNVVGGELLACSTAPLTGFFRDGCCSTGPRGSRQPHGLRGDDRGVPRASAAPPATTSRRRGRSGASRACSPATAGASAPPAGSRRTRPASRRPSCSAPRTRARSRSCRSKR